VRPIDDDDDDDDKLKYLAFLHVSKLFAFVDYYE